MNEMTRRRDWVASEKGEGEKERKKGEDGEEQAARGMPFYIPISSRPRPVRHYIQIGTPLYQNRKSAVEAEYGVHNFIIWGSEKRMITRLKHGTADDGFETDASTPERTPFIDTRQVIY